MVEVIRSLVSRSYESEMEVLYVLVEFRRQIIRFGHWICAFGTLTGTIMLIISFSDMAYRCFRSVLSRTPEVLRYWVLVSLYFLLLVDAS